MASGVDCFTFREQLYTRQQQLHESAVQYYHDVMRLCSKVDLNMDNITRLKHLYRGLRRETKLIIDIRKFNEPEDFLRELVRFEQLQKDFEPEEQDPLSMMPCQPNASFIANQSSSYSNREPYQQQSYQQHQQPYQQRQRSSPQRQPDQQQHRYNSEVSGYPGKRTSPQYSSRSSPQYRNQQNFPSKYDNRHLNEY